jgi:uncharacterized protein (DUF433 family)
VLAGKPCIDGTRVSVEAVLDTLSVTGSIAATAAAFPRVSEADVRAALAYAAGEQRATSNEQRAAGIRRRRAAQ